MKRNILLSLLLMAFIFPSFAQKDAQKKENKKKEMLEFKLDFLAKEMELRDDQKAKFNEVYTQMDNERRAAFSRMKKAEKSIKDSKNASEADYQKATKEIADAKAQMTAIESKYDKKFSQFLSQKQIYKMKEAEEKFMKRMRECRDKKAGEKKGDKR